MQRKEYIVPTWALAPTQSSTGFTLEVIKEGSIVQEIALECPQKSYFIFGRQPDIVDVLLEHPSISRQHAILQFREDGALMCLDFQSAQGTFVNKKQLEPSIYTRLYVGDIIKFGASTRQYVVKGPESHVLPEYDSENLRIFRQQAQQKSSDEKKKKEERGAALWGFGPEDEYDDGDDSRQLGAEDVEEPEYLRRDPNYDRKFGAKFESSIKDSDVDEKDAAILQKIRQKEQKIRNMQEENRRIYMKESAQDSGLTDGQNAAVARNDGRIEQLKDEIQELANTIQSKKMSRSGASAGSTTSKKGRRGGDSDSDDDLYDSTKLTEDVGTNWRLRRKLKMQSSKAVGEVGSSLHAAFDRNKGEGLSFTDLQKLVDELSKKQVDFLQQLQSHEQVVSDWKFRSSVDKDGDIESTVLEAAAKQSMQAIESIKTWQLKNDNELATVKRLLVVATPAVRVQSISKPVDVTLSDSKEHHPDNTAALAAAKLAASLMDAANRPSPTLTSSLKGNELDQKSNLAKSIEKVEKAELAEIPRVAVLNESSPPTRTDGPIVNQASLKPTPRVVGPQRPSGTGSSSSMAATIKRLAEPDDDSALVKSPKVSGKSDLEPAIKRPKANTLQDGEIVWVAPRNQTGNGKTWLNDKLGY